jgi:hypothetical protein
MGIPEPGRSLVETGLPGVVIPIFPLEYRRKGGDLLFLRLVLDTPGGATLRMF